MQMNPYLMFDGTCDAALKFYAQCLDGTVVASLKYSEGPGCGSAHPDRVMHGLVTFGDGKMLMASDCPPGQHEKMQGMYVSVHFDNPEEAERAYAALAEGGKVIMPMAETFWAIRFGMLTDQFQTPWMINCSKPQGQA